MKKIEYGLKNVHFAKRTYNTETNEVTYAKPVRVPFARSTDMSPQGEATEVYADNIIIYNAVSNQGYNGNLAFTALQDNILEEFLNEIRDEDGNLLEDANAKQVEFAMLFEFENDVKATRHVFYKCTLSRPNVASNTKENSITVDDKTLTITALPDDEIVLEKTLVKGHTTEQTTQTAYDNWYEAVKIPVLAEEV